MQRTHEFWVKRRDAAKVRFALLASQVRAVKTKRGRLLGVSKFRARYFGPGVIELRRKQVRLLRAIKKVRHRLQFLEDQVQTSWLRERMIVDLHET